MRQHVRHALSGLDIITKGVFFKEKTATKKAQYIVYLYRTGKLMTHRTYGCVKTPDFNRDIVIYDFFKIISRLEDGNETLDEWKINETKRFRNRLKRFLGDDYDALREAARRDREASN